MRNLDLLDLGAPVSIKGGLKVMDAWVQTSRTCSKTSHSAQCQRCVYNNQCEFKR